MKTKKLVNNYMMAGVGLGVGNVVLGGMGQGDIAAKISTPAANMMGVGVTAGMGMSIMNMANKYASNKRPVKVKKGKHVGYGWF
jgi:carbon starvation protein CstA